MAHDEENPVSAYLAKIGKKGGSVAGIVKGAATLTAEERKAFARKGAAARWGKKRAGKKPKAAKKRAAIGLRPRGLLFE